MLGKKLLRSTESLGKQGPQPAPAHLAAAAEKTLHRPLGMLPRGAGYRLFDFEPVADRIHLSEGDSGLGHSERPGIHSPKHDPLRSRPISAKIFFVRFSGILQ